MVQGTGDALEWALALAKAPAERIALRQRALPDGVVTVLQIATGASGDALADVVRTTGEDEADILEAARFYVREILFYRGADAYRMLGLTRDAASDTIRTHHRLLQQWLHPDRHTSDWDAIYASRVNAAWNQLRTKARRAEYDAKTPASPQDERSGSSLPMSVQLLSETAITSRANERWRRRIPVLGLFVICVGLGLMVLRDQQREPASSLPERVEAETATSREETGLTLHLPKPPTREKAGVAVELSPQRSVSSEVAMPVPKQAPFAVLSSRPSEPVSESLPPAPVVLATAKVPMALDVKMKVPAGAETPQKAAEVAVIADPGDDGEQVSIKASLSARKPAPTAVPAPSISVRGIDVDSTVAPAPAPPTRVTTQQASQAQKTGQQLLSFISSTKNTSTPPIWDGIAIQTQASQVRASLQDGGYIHGTDPQWRISGAAAVMSVDLQAKNNVGRLRVELVWREQRWLVSGLSMERAL